MGRTGFFLTISTILTILLFLFSHNSLTLGDVSIYELGNVFIGTENEVSENYTQTIDLSDSNKVKKAFYAIDKKTGMPDDLFNVKEIHTAEWIF